MTILLTGSSRGIGAAIAATLADAGRTVIGHGTASGIPADFDEPGAGPALWDAALDRAGGSIDVLVNNAGVMALVLAAAAGGAWLVGTWGSDETSGALAGVVVGSVLAQVARDRMVGR